MQTELIIVSEYCQNSRIEPSFLLSLEEGGLIDIYMMEGEKYLYISQLPDLEQYTRLYYDLSINIEGIDAIRHLLKKIDTLQQEMDYLKNRLRLYEEE